MSMSLDFWKFGLAVVTSVLAMGTGLLLRDTPFFKRVREVRSFIGHSLRSIFAAVVQRDANAPRGLLIDLFMPPDRAEDVVYNLLARYEYWVEKHGVRLARLVFFTQSVGSVVTFWCDWLLKRLKLLKMFVSS